MTEELNSYRDVIDVSLTKNIYKKNITKWLPYIGRNFHFHKILIVGLSHYDNLKSENWTKTLMKNTPNIVSVVENGLSDNNNKFFRGLERVFLNPINRELPTDKKFRNKLWKSIAFYQLIESPILNNTSHKETKKVRTESIAKLSRLINLINPHSVLMMSNSYKYHSDLSEHQQLSNKETFYLKVRKNSEIRTVYFDDFSYCAMYHPSRFHYIEKQHKLLNNTIPNFIDYLNN